MYIVRMIFFFFFITPVTRIKSLKSGGKVVGRGLSYLTSTTGDFGSGYDVIDTLIIIYVGHIRFGNRRTPGESFSEQPFARVKRTRLRVF